ncbi:MAG: GHKL domain-containing protein [Nitriliruptorales bacterium]|nr:GHKL domain-containing protein [Nitriliruptorales bacterium]
MTERPEQVLAAHHGESLDDDAWARRHRLLLWLLAAHIPGLAAVAAIARHPPGLALVEVFCVLVALAGGVVLGSRALRSAAVALGLVVGGSVLVHVTGGIAVSHLHFFVVLGLVALYQDWRPYLVAVVYVVLGYAVGGVLAPELIYDDPSALQQPWRWSAMHAGFILAVSGAHVLLWKHTERQGRAAYEYYTQLYEGERAVVARLRQTQMVKDELVGVVGHEFRTPLTAIQGFARTLEARYDRMDREAVQTCTQAIERESKRLTRMVANLLIASEDIEPSDTDRCSLNEAVDRVVRDIVETLPVAGRNIPVHVPTTHVVRVAREPTYQLLFNLIDNAVKFAAPASDVRVTSRGEDDWIVLEVTNVGTPIDPGDRERIFDAFVQADSSSTRRYGGMGLGLHIVRKIVTAYGGKVGVFGDGPVVILRVWLPRAGDSEQPPQSDAPSLSIDLRTSPRTEPRGL